MEDSTRRGTRWSWWYLLTVWFVFDLSADLFEPWIQLKKSEVWAAGHDGFYADNGVDQTIIYKSLPKRERKAMQQEILNLLGLHHRPKPREHGTENSAPKYLIELYRSFLDEETGNLKVNEFNEARTKMDRRFLTNNSIHAINDSDLIMSFVNRIHHHAPHLRHDRDRRFWFDVTEVEPQENIIGAELRLYRNRSLDTLPMDEVYTFSLFALQQGHDPEDRLLSKVDVIEVPHDDDGWLVFNVTGPMINWITFPKSNLGLYLKIGGLSTDRDIHPHEAGLTGIKGPDEKQPFMVSFFKTPTHLHVRRTRAAAKRQRSDLSFDSDYWNPHASSDYYHQSKKNCQKKALYVSFKDLGWQDWIIAPDGYAAFFCDGECSFPLNAHMNATNHAIVQTLVHLINPGSVPKPCCAPTKLTPIMVLYFDDSYNVILKKYKNMVVKSCGCH